MASTPLTKDHLPHPPIPLVKMVSANNHEVPRADMKEWRFPLNGEAAVVDRHSFHLTSTSVLIATAVVVWQLMGATGVSAMSRKADTPKHLPG